MAEERIDEEEIAFAQQWRDAMKRQVSLSARLKPASRCLRKSTQMLILRSCGSN